MKFILISILVVMTSLFTLSLADGSAKEAMPPIVFNAKTIALLQAHLFHPQTFYGYIKFS